MDPSIPGESQYQPQLKGKDFLTIADFSTADLISMLEEAIAMKKMQKEGKPHPYLSGKVLGMIFDKSSTRTRVSFEVGMMQLGGQAIFLNKNDIQLGRGESIEDTAQVLSRYIDGIMIRTSSHENVETLAAHATVPVINALTDLHHPAQAMADLLTIWEHKGKLSGLKACFIGDGNNVAHSFIEGAVKVGMNISIATPSRYEPNAEIIARANEVAEQSGAELDVTHDPREAIQGADVVATDVWTSMGQEEEEKERLSQFQPFQVNADLCTHAHPDFIFMHCLPAQRGAEVSGEIIDGPHSVVFDEAENRLHAQKGILKLLMNE